MHWPQMGRPQRWHLMPVIRSGCRKQPTNPAAANSLGDVDRFDDHRVERTVAAPGPDAGNLVDDLPARCVGNLTEDGVPPGEMGGRTDGDEELRAVRSRPGVRHG